jgi:S-adenosylmethionine:tRNA ribosyltransferase-isomerase
MPVPPYIHTPLERPNEYQTVFALHPGSVAAPTAGLHFTHQLLVKIEERGISMAKITLHVGLDTFAPVTEEDPESHLIHSEWCQLSDKTAETINAASSAGNRIIAVGTTSVRTLETVGLRAPPKKRAVAFEGQTNIYILPGFHFHATDAMLTNFHLPRSTLLMMVCAFAGREKVLKAYQVAIEEGYRFYSFGDAMLII